MSRIRWYGPTLVLMVAVLTVMLAGPSVARELAYNYQGENLKLVRQSLEANPVLDELSRSFRKVSQVVEPSVVHIQVSARRPSGQRGDRRGIPRDRLREWFFGPDQRGEFPGQQPERDNEQFDQYNPARPYGNGSGWVYDEQGHIVTNNHVIDGADVITVRFYDGTERRATIVGTDPKTDIAVIKVDGGHLHPAAVATQPVQQGDIVFAFGSPLGFKFSMSQGIVSAVGRNELGIIRGGYEDFIQTDAAINPGNSGGPLTDIHGKVVGMNTAIATRTGFSNGLGFAIPTGNVVKVVDALIRSGKVTRGYLGIEIADLDPRMARSFSYEGKGVLVVNVMPQSPSERAGLREGDIITALNDNPMTSADELRNTVADIAPDTTVQLNIFREGKQQTLEVTIGLLPESLADAGAVRPGEPEASPDAQARQVLLKIGLERLHPITPEMIERFNLTNVEGGLFVQSVRRDSAAALAGLVPGVIITHVMSEPVNSVNELIVALNRHDLSQGVRLRIVVEGRARFVLVELPSL